MKSDRWRLAFSPWGLTCFVPVDVWESSLDLGERWRWSTRLHGARKQHHQSLRASVVAGVWDRRKPFRPGQAVTLPLKLGSICIVQNHKASKWSLLQLGLPQGLVTASECLTHYHASFRTAWLSLSSTSMTIPHWICYFMLTMRILFQWPMAMKRNNRIFDLFRGAHFLRFLVGVWRLLCELRNKVLCRSQRRLILTLTEVLWSQWFLTQRSPSFVERDQ